MPFAYILCSATTKIVAARTVKFVYMSLNVRDVGGNILGNGTVRVNKQDGFEQMRRF